jgi:hypothetical protein
MSAEHNGHDDHGGHGNGHGHGNDRGGHGNGHGHGPKPLNREHASWSGWIYLGIAAFFTWVEIGLFYEDDPVYQRVIVGLVIAVCAIYSFRLLTGRAKRLFP